MRTPQLPRRVVQPRSLKSRDRRLALAFVTLGLLLAWPASRFVGAASAPVGQAAPARLSEQVSVSAAGRGGPYVHLTDGRAVLTSYTGAAEARAALERNEATPLSLTTADFDEDGVPDLVGGYATQQGGALTLLRGNVDAIYPNAPEAQQRKAAGTYTAAPFLSPAQVFALDTAPDFIGGGDFDADGHWDVVFASRGDASLHLLAGDGRGGFGPPQTIALRGAVTALTTGEVNRADGLTDVVVGISAQTGAQVLVFEGPHGALKSAPEIIRAPSAVTALALGQLDDSYEMDLAAAAGRELMIMHGRDRQLTGDADSRAKVRPARLERQAFAAGIRSLALGNFKARQQTEIALLLEDGTAHLLSHNQGGALKQGAVRGAEWQRDTLPGDGWPGATQLISAKVSSLPGDELVALDAAGRLRIMHPAQPKDANGPADSAAVTAAPTAELAALDTEGGAPVAALPMRLNSDAFSDLVVLDSGQSAPVTIGTTAAMTFDVTNTNDTGPGSLRQAVLNSEANPGADTITFHIGSGVKTITMLSNLPLLSDPVTIDATTQPGYAGQPLIELNGISNTKDYPAFAIYAGSSTVRGFVINRFHSDGLSLFQNPGNIVEGNYIGTDVTGKIALGNDFRGIGVGEVPPNTQSANNRIGGTTAAARNVISGNKAHGIRILIAGSVNNVVQGNYIGTDVTGTVALGNAFEGVYVGGGVNNTIGGTTAGAGNLISANGFGGTGRTSGLAVSTFPFQTGATGNLVQGNFVGTNASGTASLGNAHEGVLLEDGASGNTVGGTTAAARNLISGNHTNGIDVGFNKPVTLNQVLGNYIGTDVTGNNPVGNDLHGIFINVNSDNNLIQDNRIAFNGGSGIFIPNTTTDPGNPGIRITIDTNTIYRNGSLGIDLGTSGITPNDPQDTDGGANLQQNFPVLTATGPPTAPPPGEAAAPEAISPQATVTVNGTLNSTPNTTFVINWYFSPAPQCVNNQVQSPPLAFGKVPGVVTDAQGNAPFSFPFSFPLGTTSGVINTTATDSQGNTSEFSACLPVTAPPPGTLQFGAAAFSVNEGGGSALITVTRTGGSGGAVSVAYATANGSATAGSDYTTASSTLTWADGDVAAKTFSVPITNDALDEPDETVNLTLSNPTGGAALGTQTTAVLTITDDDPPPSLAINDVAQNEGNSGASAFTFAVTLSAASGRTVTVDYATANGTATAGSDYTAASGTLTFNPGETGKQISVSVNGDTTVEPNETFTVTLSNPANATIARPQGTGTINNDDAQPIVQFSAADYTFSEAATSALLVVTRTGNLAVTSTVAYATVDNSAAVRCDNTTTLPGVAFARCDYATSLDTLTFNPGDTQKTIAVPLIDDAHVEPSETFQVTLSTPNGATLGTPATATVTLTDNDTATTPNPVFSSPFFVRQNYLDFLAREPDQGGFNAYLNLLNGCPDVNNLDPNAPSAACDRITISGAFFGSPEFKDKGVYTIVFYRAALNRLPRYAEFAQDLRAVTGRTGAEAAAKRAAFATDFVQRQEFVALYPATMTNDAYVGALFARYNLAQITTPDPQNPEGATKVTLTQGQLTGQLTAGALTRAQVLRAVVQSDQVGLGAEALNAFVAAQYYGYLRRTPDTPGFNAWVNYLTAHPDDFRTMVNGFMNSTEYRLRFGPAQ